jgi:TRAP-type C4-dicarboxylate transport system permease small subunit
MVTALKGMYVHADDGNVLGNAVPASRMAFMTPMATVSLSATAAPWGTYSPSSSIPFMSRYAPVMVGTTLMGLGTVSPSISISCR